MPTTFYRGNQVMLNDNLSHIALFVAAGYGITSQTVLPAKAVHNVDTVGGDPFTVGHHQWVNVELPNGNIQQFSGAFFKIAPGGRINETVRDI